MIHAVVGIIKKEDKILISKRPSDKSYAGYWEFPGGKIEAHETAEVALKRELREELGIELEFAIPLLDYLYDYPDYRLQLAVWKVNHYLGEPYEKEGQNLLWVLSSELSRYQFLPASVELLKNLS